MSMYSGSVCRPDVPEPPKVFLNEPTESKVLPNRRIRIEEEKSGRKRYSIQFSILWGLFWLELYEKKYSSYEYCLESLNNEYNSKIKSICYKCFN